MQWTFSLDEIDQTAKRFWEKFPEGKIYAFEGNMGAGKTSFISSLCRIRGVTDMVSSPTFSIINEYGYPGGQLYHLDLYRLKNEEEAIRAGVEDCLLSGEICLVEWPDRAPGIFPEDCLVFLLETVNEDTRTMSLVPRMRKNSG